MSEPQVSNAEPLTLEQELRHVEEVLQAASVTSEENVKKLGAFLMPPPPPPTDEELLQELQELLELELQEL